MKNLRNKIDSYWNLSKSIPMVSKHHGTPHVFYINDVKGIEIPTELRVSKTISIAKGEPPKSSANITDTMWTNFNKKHLEVVLAAKKEQYKIQKADNQ
jgi:hypothetical protein